jgi:hypothetical protein
VTVPVTNLDFSPEQEAELRQFCGLRPGDRELTPDDLVVVFEARKIIDDESARLAAQPPDADP